MLFANLPRDAFLRAASYSSVAMMAASLTSDYMGFGLAMRHKDSSYMFTFYLTIASSSAALLLVVMGSVANVIPPLPTSLHDGVSLLPSPRTTSLSFASRMIQLDSHAARHAACGLAALPRAALTRPALR